MIVTGFSGVNIAISLNVVEFKCLMETLYSLSEADLVKASESLHNDGFNITPADIKTHIDHGRLVVASILEGVNENEEDGPETTEATKVIASVKPFTVN